VVTVGLIILGFVAGRKLKKRPGGLQVITEKLVTMLYKLVEDTMGKHNLKFAPYIGTLFLSSLFGSLIGTTGLFRSATADLSVTLAWALVTSVMVWYCNIKNFGVKAWLKGYTEPIFVMTPMNLIGEVAQPLSMAFRHFGNAAGGSVLTTLIYDALAIATSIVFGWLPGVLGEIPFLQVFGWLPDLLGEIPFLQAGIPAVLSLYFDFFSGFVQAFVFCLLTMIYVGSACPPPEEVKAIREANKKRKSPKAD
jgi:F-type H+-transporting ATPase subunit a